MFKIEDLMSEDFSAYPEDAQAYMVSFTERLKEYIKEELVEDIAEKMIKSIAENKESFISMLAVILENGHKGFNNMSTGTLVNMYLGIKREEEFYNLLEKVSNEI